MQILGPETPKRKEATFRLTQDTPSRMTPSPIGKVWLKAILELEGNVAASPSQFSSILLLNELHSICTYVYERASIL